MGRIIPIKELWAEGKWVVWLDKKGWHDATGHVIRETEDELVIGNREDHLKYQIDKKKIQFIEEVT